jgi:hypothetical protein
MKPVLPPKVHLAQIPTPIQPLKTPLGVVGRTGDFHKTG